MYPKRRLTPEQIKEILSINTGEQITRTLFNDLFSKKSKTNQDGKITYIEPKYYVSDEFDLPANALKNNKLEVKDTTVGIYLFNLFVLSDIFGARISYINDTITPGRMKDYEREIGENILAGHINTEQFATYEKRVMWISYFTELFMPGLTFAFMSPNPEVMKEKERLLKENPDILKENKTVDYVNKIEKPLLEKAKSVLEKDPAWELYKLGAKPSFSNNYKNSCITNGPLMDPITKKHVINTNSYSEVIPIQNYDIMANKAVTGSYSRGVKTAEAGALSKQINCALQSISLAPRGTDCGTSRCYKVKLDKSNINSFKYSYLKKSNGELVLLTADNINDYLDKVVSIRSPLFCESVDVCNKCMGELPYYQEFYNVGLIASKITSVLSNLSMKIMHDITVKTARVDIKKYVQFN